VHGTVVLDLCGSFDAIEEQDARVADLIVPEGLVLDCLGEHGVPWLGWLVGAEHAPKPSEAMILLCFPPEPLEVLRSTPQVCLVYDKPALRAEVIGVLADELRVIVEVFDRTSFGQKH
jgi:hypothetical protein